MDLARKELRVVDEVVPLLVGIFQWVRAREQSLIAVTGVNRDTVPGISEMCQNVIDNTAALACLTGNERLGQNQSL